MIHEEALQVARSIQKPGQTKEQTRLIAHGIAKGIALYKKQQSAKARERDKGRKRMLRLSKVKETNQEQRAFGEVDQRRASRGSAVAATLLAGGSLFAIMALLNLVRVIANWSLALGPWDVPSWASLIAATALAGLSAWFFYTAATTH